MEAGARGPAQCTRPPRCAVAVKLNWRVLQELRGVKAAASGRAPRPGCAMFNIVRRAGGLPAPAQFRQPGDRHPWSSGQHHLAPSPSTAHRLQGLWRAAGPEVSKVLLGRGQRPAVPPGKALCTWTSTGQHPHQ